MEKLQKEVILPFCLFTYNDPNTKTYYSYVSPPDVVMLQDGTMKYVCPRSNKTYQGWEYSGVFYAITPYMRPIPMGMRLFCALTNDSFPYNTKDVFAEFDPFQPISENCVKFITYSEPVPNTKALYLHKKGSDEGDDTTVYISFDKNSPYSVDGGKYGVTVIYVMTPDTVDKDISALEFSCINGRCIPHGKEEVPFNKVSIFECLLKCNKIGNAQKPQTVFDYIQDEAKQMRASRQTKIKINLLRQCTLFGLLLIVVYCGYRIHRK